MKRMLLILLASFATRFGSRFFFARRAWAFMKIRLFASINPVLPVNARHCTCGSFVLASSGIVPDTPLCATRHAESDQAVLCLFTFVSSCFFFLVCVHVRRLYGAQAFFSR